MLHADLPPFPGFRDEGLQFLRDLKHHNDRDWFKPRKQTFDDEVRWPLRCLVADFARRTLADDLPLTGDPKRSIFRIYRDMRFSKKKKPYKTHVGAVLSRSGERKDPGAVYVHVEPGASFIAGGYWKPENDLLRRLRVRMAERSASFLEMTEQFERQGTPIEIRSSLKRMPSGFGSESDGPLADWLKAKGLVARRDIADEDLRHPAFTDTVIETARAMEPLLAFGWDAMEPVDSGR